MAAVLAASPSAASAFETHAFKTSFGAPASDVELSLAADSGLAVNETTHDIYVADTGNRRVVEFSEAGTFIRAFGADVGGAGVNVCTSGCVAGMAGSTPGAFEEPAFIAIDNAPGGEGDVYVGDPETNLVTKFEADGTLIAGWGNNGLAEAPNGQLAGKTQAEPFTVLGGIAVDSAGTLAVFMREPELLFKFGQTGAFSGEIETPRGSEAFGLGVDGTGNFFKVNGDRTVEKFGPAGAAEDLGQVNESTTAANLGVDSSTGNLFVDTGSKVEAFAFEPSGEVQGTLCTPASFAGCPPSDTFGEGGEIHAGAGVAVDGTSHQVYVADSSTNNVAVFGALTLPDVHTEAATAVGPHEATLHGTIEAAGGPQASCEFQYTTKTAFEAGGFSGASSAPCTPPGPFTGSSSEAVSAALTELAAGTDYVFRLRGSNENGANPKAPKAGILAFSTVGPLIASESASEVTATSATLETEINPHGLPTTYHFEYDTAPYAEGQPPHGTSTPTGSAGGGEVNVFRSAPIQGLAPLTTYHYRVVATNSLGTSAGEDRTFTTQGPGSSLLPDNRAYEMVTPPNKFGSPLEPITEEGGTIQAAADGSAFAEVALGPLGSGAKGVRSPSNSQWFSVRAPGGGWSTADITTAHEEIVQIHVGTPSEYKLFAADLSSGIVEPEGVTRLEPENPANTERTPYRRDADGFFVPLVNADNVPPNTQFGGEEEKPGSRVWINGVEFRTATPDLGHLVLSSPALLTEEFEPGFEPIGLLPNFYELTAGRLTLASVLPDGHSTSEAGLVAAVGFRGLSMRGAISDDGNRFVFEASGQFEGHPEIHLYLRANATQPPSAISGTAVDGSQCTEPAKACTIQLDALQGGSGGQGAPTFQAASADGRRVFFTDASQLTEDSTAQFGKPDLYMCEVELAPGPLACNLTDLSVDPNPGEAANVFGGPEGGSVSAIDASGAHVYFTANGVLTNTPNAAGETAVPGVCSSEGDSTCNLYVYDTDAHSVALVAVLSTHDSPVWGPRFGLGHLTARSSSDGRFFTFMSTRPLTGYDNRDATSGRPAAEVFLYDTQTGTLSCASCNPSGARPAGFFDTPRSVFPGPLVDHPHSWEQQWVAGSIPGWTQRSLVIATYQSRFLSNSGRLFFNAADALVPQDTNGVMDVYEYEPPGVGDCTTSSPTYGSASGGCVSLISSGTSPEESAFLDASESGDDVFFLTASQLVRKDTDTALDVYDASVGGGEPEEASPPACEGDACQQPATPPMDATPGSLTFQGAGNVVQCPKGKVKKSGHCVKRKKAKHHKKHKGHKHHGASNKKAGK